MGQAALNLPMTAAEFLVWDAAQTVKHEFVRGDVFAMTGAADAHVTVAGNIYSVLRRHLKGSTCRTYINDMKLQVDAADAFYYPDVMVTCSASDAAESLVKREPVLIIEVLSPSTAAYDRGAKFAAYRQLPSLREYALIDPDTRRCDVFRKGQVVGEGEGGLWVLHPFDATQGLALASVALEIAAAALWDEVPLEGARAAA